MGDGCGNTSSGEMLRIGSMPRDRYAGIECSVASLGPYAGVNMWNPHTQDEYSIVWYQEGGFHEKISMK